MNTIEKKRTYSTPHLECVKLDNEISLVLISSDPEEPTSNSDVRFAPDYFNSNPFNKSFG
jgi:hypothetical protein